MEGLKNPLKRRSNWLRWRPETIARKFAKPTQGGRYLRSGIGSGVSGGGSGGGGTGSLVFHAQLAQGSTGPAQQYQYLLTEGGKELVTETGQPLVTGQQP